MVDGHTTIGLNGWQIGMASSALQGLVSALKKASETEGEVSRRRWTLRMRDRYDVRKDFEVEAHVRGSRSGVNSISLHLEGIAYITLNLRARSVRVELKAGGLWSMGFEALSSWLTWSLSAELLGMDRADPLWDAPDLEQAGRHGWRVKNVELCQDMTGLDSILEAEPGCFMGRQKSALMVGSDGVETIAVGSRSSPVSLCMYDKSKQARITSHGGGYYRPAWEAGGWDRESRVVRVELRLRDEGMRWMDDETGECLDLRDLATLADADARARVWQIALYSKRLVDPETATRRERMKLDHRWAWLMRQAGGPEGFEAESWRQDRSLQRGVMLHRLEKRGDSVGRALASFEAAIMPTDQALLDEPDDAVFAPKARERMRGAFEFYLASRNPGQLRDDLGRGAKRRALEEPLLGPEIEAVTEDNFTRPLRYDDEGRLLYRPLVSSDLQRRWEREADNN